MGQGYFTEGKHTQRAVFDVFFRPNKLITYSVAAGMEQAAEYLENLHFDDCDIAYPDSLGIFPPDHRACLTNPRFAREFAGEFFVLFADRTARQCDVMGANTDLFFVCYKNKTLQIIYNAI